MEQSPAEIIDALEGRPWEIARTVKREIEGVAPYAELGLALGVPTWYHFERVVSLISYPNACALHFWKGDALDERFPGILKQTRAAPIRYVELGSMLDVDERVKTLLKEAFALQLELIAEEDSRTERNAALSF